MSLDPILIGSQFQVNTYTTDYQRYSDIAALSDGGYVVTWSSDGQDTSSYGVYAQRYDADGVAVGGEFSVNSHTNSSQTYSRITGLDGGGYVITWYSIGQDGSSAGIYAQMYDASGAVYGSEFLVNTTTDYSQIRPDIVSLSDGGFVVVWASSAQDASGYGIFGQRYDSAGVAQGLEFQANTYETDQQRHTSVTGLDGGGFVVSWESFDQDGDEGGIYAQVFDAVGAKDGSEIHVSTEAVERQEYSSITALTSGGFVVTWTSYLQDGSGDGVYGQMYNASGAVVGSEFLVNTTTASYQNASDVTAMADGGFLVVFKSGRIYMQRYDSSGDAIGGQVQIDTTSPNTKYDPEVTTLENGAFVVSWTDWGLDGDGHGIFAQQFAAQLFGTSGVDVIEDTVGAGWINGQGGADTLKGLGGKDTIYGGGGADTLSGGASKDFLYGQGGEDTLKGGKGNDELDGGTKDDKLTGGDGKDKFIFMDGSGMDKITDFEDDIDTFRLDEDLWGGGMTKQQVINTYASVVGVDIIFDFGADQLKLKGFTDLTELKDDMAFI